MTVRWHIIERKPKTDTTSTVRELTVATWPTLEEAQNDADYWRKGNPQCIYLIRPVEQ